MTAWLLMFWVYGWTNYPVSIQGIESEQACHDLYKAINDQGGLTRNYRCIQYRTAK